MNRARKAKKKGCPMRVARLVGCVAVALLVAGVLGSACSKKTAPAPAAPAGRTAPTAAGQAGAPEGVSQTICPVMKGPIDKNLFVDFEGKRVYVCCTSCLAEVRKDPAKYVKQLEDGGVVLQKATASAAGGGSAGK
jgi:hypothetical protein